ncbi:MAG: FG-GAP repeat domain-containing protein [Pyrinomonadaceae bacterium]
MKTRLSIVALVLCLSAAAGLASGQVLINEISADPPGVDGPCEYYELRGTPLASVPNIYFVQFQGNLELNPGGAMVVVSTPSLSFGSNGLFAFVGTQPCGSRTYPAETLVISNAFMDGPDTIKNGTQSYFVISSTTALTPNFDYDANNDGVLELPAGASVIDSIAFSDGGTGDFTYAPALTASGGAVGAATRFVNNSTANSAAAWFGGALDGTANSSVYYSTTVRTANFPQPPLLGVLTPAAPNNLIVVDNFARPPFDFDGDQKTDISVFRPNANAEWWMLRSSNGSVYASQFGTSSDVPTPADFTGDGKTDIAFYRPSAGQWFVLRSEDQTFYAFPFGVNTDTPAPADYDGDGRADAAVYRPGGTWFIARSTGGVQTTQFGIAGDKPVAADYNGDGKADIAVFRPSGGSGSAEWWILYSSGGTFAAAFGSSTDKTVPGDYTGDGKADIAFFRPSNGNWFVLRSENQSFFAFPFGTSGDQIAPGDYDGDGKFDAAVYRASAQTWYVNRSTGGVQIVNFGAASDQAVPSIYVR